MTNPEDKSATDNNSAPARRQESARELYAKNPHWTGADLYEYRMRTMTDAERDDYNQGLKDLNDFSEAVIDGLSGGKHNIPNILDEDRDASGDNIISDEPDELDLDLSLIDGVYQLPSSDEPSRSELTPQKPIPPENSRR